MSRKKQPTTAELRKFGLVVSIALSVVGGFFVWRGREWAVWVYVPAGTLLLLGLVAPEALRQVERIWMIVADVLGAIMTRVILVLSFFFVITPIGLLVRLFSRDNFGKSFDKKAETYWVAVPPDGPGSRPEQPF
jgi:hypothetical protein